MSGHVLVTGGSGFIGAHTAAALLGAGHTVRLTVSRPERTDDARAAVTNLLGDEPPLEVVVANLNEASDWRRAVAGCTDVIHVASPLPLAQPKDRQELIRPARDGALRVLDAARAEGVRRVVMTSSVAAIIGSRTDKEVFDENDWTDPDDTTVSPYNQSKAVAERAARQDVAEHGGPEFVTVNPALVVGPIARPEVNASVEIVAQLMNGSIPAVPDYGYAYIDVRDVADLHVASLLTPEAAGGRFPAAAEFLWMEEVATLLRTELGSAAARVPTRRAPRWLIRLMGLFDPGARLIAPDLGVRRTFDCSTTTEVLGWTPRPVSEAIVDCAESLIANGLVRP